MPEQKIDLKFSISPLGDIALEEEFKLKEIHRQVLHKDLSKKFRDELKLTSNIYNPLIPQNLELDIIGRRRSGKSFMALNIVEYGVEKIGGFEFDINEHLFYTNQDLVDYLMENMKTLKNTWLMKDEEHLEIGQDSFVNRIKIERFADECGKRRINIVWCSPQKQFGINTDYTMRRLDFDRSKNVARSLLFDGDSGIPLGVIYTGLPSHKLLKKYDKFKDEHLKTLLVGERILDYRTILKQVIKTFDIEQEPTDKKKRISKGELRAYIGMLFGDLSLNQVDSIVSTYSLWKKGLINLDDKNGKL